MRFQVLGPLVVSTEAGAVAITAPKQRTLLAALLVAAGRPVSAERLVNELWPEGPPSTASAALQVYVSGLRKALGDRVRTVPGGYLLDVPVEDVDAHQFEAMITRKSGSGLADALSLWRGPAFDGVTLGPDAAAAALRLAELRLSARQEIGRAHV
jgi:DNA-binding SARP family transcriptional activator